MVSTTPDRRTDRATDGSPRIDQSVFAAMAAVPVPITVDRFHRWFACLATAGRVE